MQYKTHNDCLCEWQKKKESRSPDIEDVIEAMTHADQVFEPVLRNYLSNEPSALYCFGDPEDSEESPHTCMLFEMAKAHCRLLRDSCDFEYFYQNIHYDDIRADPFLIVGRVLHETDPSRIVIIDWEGIVAVYPYPMPVAPLFMSPMLRWENTTHFASSPLFNSGLQCIARVLHGKRPMVSTLFSDDTKYQIALEQVKASGFPFTTEAENRVISIARPGTLGESFDLEAWLQSFTVQVKDNPVEIRELLS